MNSLPHRNLIFDTIEAVGLLTAPSQVVQAFASAATRFGFTSLGINDLPLPERGANPLILAEIAQPSFRDCYIHEQFYLIDHLAAHARVTNKPFRYSEAPYHPNRARENARYMQALDTFAMGKGLNVPLGHAANLPACVWLAGKNPDLDDDTKQAIQWISLFAASQARALAGPPDAGQLHKLTAREREVLKWTAQGKSAWETSEMLKISKRTVDEHAKNAARKLGASNRTHAVAIALRDRLIAL